MKFRTNRVTPTEWKHSEGEDCSAELHGDACIQKDALTPREILERYANGLDVKRLQKFGIFDRSDTTLNDLVLSSRFRDLTQIDELIRKADKMNENVAEAQRIHDALVLADKNKDGKITGIDEPGIIEDPPVVE